MATEPKVEQLRHWDLLAGFRRLLEKLGRRPRRRKGGPARKLTEHDYLCAFLFAQFNPVIGSMRGLCGCSHFRRVQQEVCSRPISLGSFSEAQSAFGPERAAQAYERLVGERLRMAGGAGPLRPQQARALVCLVDSSVFRALPRMCWAMWRKQYSATQRAVRLHLKFKLFNQEPGALKITEGRCCEREAFAQMIEQGEFYVGDRNYGRDYGLLEDLDDAGCGFIVRLCESARLSVIKELALSEADRAAGVVSDQIVRLGWRESAQTRLLRVVRIEKPELDEPLIIITNQLNPEGFSAALLAEIYRYRWAVELFFRWFKCVLAEPKNWHWLAESPDGVAIQIYTALIGSLLLARHVGQLPDKRSMEALQFHSMGMATDEELEVVVAAQARKKSR